MLGYIDPGSGSMIVQIVAGSIIGGMFFLKTYWEKAKQTLIKITNHSNRHVSASGK